jgi:hypothetical protein
MIEALRYFLKQSLPIFPYYSGFMVILFYTKLTLPISIYLHYAAASNREITVLFVLHTYALTVCILRRFTVVWLLLTNMWYSSYVFPAFNDRGFTVLRLLVGYLK